jgi:hypothetical protein
LGVKRTLRIRPVMSAFDPKRTCQRPAWCVTNGTISRSKM